MNANSSSRKLSYKAFSKLIDCNDAADLRGKCIIITGHFKWELSISEILMAQHKVPRVLCVVHYANDGIHLTV